VRHRALYPVTVSRRLATALSDHDGRNQNPRKGCAALVLITSLSAGLGQLGSGRRGCHRHHKHQSQRRESLPGLAVGRVARTGVCDAAGWLRPYLAMRLLAVYDLTSLQPADTALSLALLTQALDPATRLAAILGLGQSAADRSLG
jgi:hypothetical protein